MVMGHCVLQDGFGFLRSPIPRTYDLMIFIFHPARSDALIYRRGFNRLRDSPPKDGERYFALVKVDSVNKTQRTQTKSV